MTAKGRLQGWAAKLLLLWVGIFNLFLFQICNYVTAVFLSGNARGLLRPCPLRTVLDSFPSYGSSSLKAD
ncbi:hypothetical protein QA597_10880 [Marinilabiliaceae bacterium ANBcel2]|nr:hypothetical protein [Marinilabiliaceae bacterium ANBcel2]